MANNHKKFLLKCGESEHFSSTLLTEIMPTCKCLFLSSTTFCPIYAIAYFHYIYFWLLMAKNKKRLEKYQFISFCFWSKESCEEIFIGRHIK